MINKEDGMKFKQIKELSDKQMYSIMQILSEIRSIETNKKRIFSTLMSISTTNLTLDQRRMMLLSSSRE